MTESIYKQAQLVQLTPAGEWYVAIPHPERPDILAVDTGKNLTFAAEFEPEVLATVQPVLALNRLIDLRLEFIPWPGGIHADEGSAFNLLANALYQAIADVQQQTTNPRNQLILLTLLALQAVLGQSLHQALTTSPAREETLYAEHDFIAQGLQARLPRANWGVAVTTQLAFAYHRPSLTRRRLCDLPLEERPLYRLHRHGSDALATAELLALVLGTAEAPGIADELLTRCGSLHQLARTSKEQLMRVRGIGETQAARLVAVLELSRRLQAPPAEERPRVTSPADAAALLTPRMAHLEQEALWVILLDTRNRVLKMTEIYKGSLNTSVVRTGEIFRPAIEAAAAAVIIAHNHPSLDPSPSPEDITVTRQIVQAGKLLDIECLDHIIIGRTFVSLKERSLGFD